MLGRTAIGVATELSARHFVPGVGVAGGLTLQLPGARFFRKRFKVRVRLEGGYDHRWQTRLRLRYRGQTSAASAPATPLGKINLSAFHWGIAGGFRF